MKSRGSPIICLSAGLPNLKRSSIRRSYVRDNIHVSLLAIAYVNFVERLPEASVGSIRAATSEAGFICTSYCPGNDKQRLGLKCEIELKEQTDFSEPMVRINTDILDATALGWNENAAWDELAEYYGKLMKRPE